MSKLLIIVASSLWLWLHLKDISKLEVPALICYESRTEVIYIAIESITQSINQSINQSVSQLINQSINQSVN